MWSDANIINLKSRAGFYGQVILYGCAMTTTDADPPVNILN